MPPVGDGDARILGVIRLYHVYPSALRIDIQVARAVRQYLLAERSANKQWVKAAGYWRRGATATHEKIED